MLDLESGKSQSWM